MVFSARSVASVFAAILLAASSCLALDTPLSNQSIREAYFLGQRHDGSVPRLLDSYTKHLPPPKTGPYISSLEILTPFAQLAQFADAYVGNYSAQQAQLDHQQQQEFVKIIIRVQLTDSFGRFMNNPAYGSSSSAPAFLPRPYDFWKDFRVQISSGNQMLLPSTFQGKAESACGRRGGPCILTGATITIEFPAESFPHDSATALVTPPEGDPVSVNLDLAGLR
jgi:hypothetical protein